jgi:hypothetical protein
VVSEVIWRKNCTKLSRALCKVLVPTSKYVAPVRTRFTQLHKRAFASQIPFAEEIAHLKYYSNLKCH